MIEVPYSDDVLTGGLVLDRSATNGLFGLMANVTSIVAQLNTLFASGPINVMAPPYNAVGDGIRDDWAGIQAALDVGVPVFFPVPPNKYHISKKLSITRSGTSMLCDGDVMIEGNQIQSAMMLEVMGTALAPIFKNNIVGNFIFWRGVTSGAGSGCIEWAYSNYGNLVTPHFYNGFAPLLVHDTTRLTVVKPMWHETVAFGIGNGQYLGRFYANAGLTLIEPSNLHTFGTKANTKIIIDYDNDWFNVFGGGVGQFRLTKSAGTFAPRWVNFFGSYMESALAIAGFDFDNCSAVNAYGCYGNVGLAGASFGPNAIGVTLDNFTAVDNQQDGVIVQGGTSISILNSKIASNNAAGAANNSGVHVTGATNGLKIRGNRIKNDIASSHTHGYGILINNGANVTGLDVGENDIANFLTAAFQDFSVGSTYVNQAAAPGALFANVGAPANGSFIYVVDGTAASNPLTGGGTGCFAIRQNGAWKGL